MASIDRGMMNDRMAAIGRGEVDPLTGEFRPPTGPGGEGGGEFGGPGRGGRGGPGGEGGRGGPPGQFGRGGPGGGPGGPGGPGRLGGRGVQQNPYAFTANYAFGGSALDSAPYQLRPDTPASTRPYSRHNFGGSVSGPVRIPRVYNGTRRTNFQFTYSGNQSNNLFDQYATVPTDAIRSGDFSSTAAVGGRPADRIAVRRQYHPREPHFTQRPRAPQLPARGESARDDAELPLRDDERLLLEQRQPASHAQLQRSAGWGARRRRRPRRSGRWSRWRRLRRAGRPRRARRAWQPGHDGEHDRAAAVSRERRRAGQRVSDGRRDHQRVVDFGAGRAQHLAPPRPARDQRQRDAVDVDVARIATPYLVDVAGDAGINGVSADPFTWGVPSLSFSSYSGLRDMTPTQALGSPPFDELCVDAPARRARDADWR